MTMVAVVVMAVTLFSHLSHHLPGRSQGQEGKALQSHLKQESAEILFLLLFVPRGSHSRDRSRPHPIKSKALGGRQHGTKSTKPESK